jgi:pimeloyl-ACP methyl ester carboxylesterase
MKIVQETRKSIFVARVEADQKVLEDRFTPTSIEGVGEVRVARFGSGPPLVCVPIVNEVNFAYLPQVRELSKYFEVILYEPKLSDATRVSVRDRAEELRAIITTLVPPKVNLLAWSDAGSVAYLAAKLWPEMLDRVAFLGLPDRYTFYGPLGTFVRTLYEYDIHKAIPNFVMNVLLAWHLGGRQIKRAWVYRELGKISNLKRFFKHSILPCMVEHRPDGALPGIRSLVIGGDSDALVKPAQMTRMAQLLDPAAQAVLVPGGEHFLGYASGEAVDSLLLRFFRAA